MRARKKSWTDKEIKHNEFIIQEPENWHGKWSEYFNNNKPINLEIGCGKGRFIAAAAQAFDENFIGLERAPTVLAQAARLARESSAEFVQPGEQTVEAFDKYANTGQHNLAYIISNVENLGNLFAPGEVATLYINFCDPWPNKKKWQKRRLTHARFLSLYQTLGINTIMFKTDNRELFEFSIEQFSAQDWFIKNVSLDLRAMEQDPRFITEYEQKFAEVGPIFRLEAYARPHKRSCVKRTVALDAT
ncbi:MAG: tRNA (guanosine(46)-N7)-methyltransferase TrmB [Clostridiales bacterium]|jgi:tRNA (guanine-N7-)-methyltransferase|nr:tRNA (guanosine(46)-N7)-methyltransferase TrmB [Clostridiales bacterium]